MSGSIDVSELMTDPEFAREFTRRRPTGAFAADGSFAPGYDDSTLVGVVQPASSDDMKILPQGTRLDNVRVFWVADCEEDSAVRAGDGKTFESDVLLLGNEAFRVIRAEPRREDGGYFRVWAEGFVT